VRLGLIVDNLRLSGWQAEALSRIAEDAEFLVFSCTNSRRHTQPLKHALYYPLRLRSLDSSLTRTQPIPTSISIAQSVEFAAETAGAWQSLPPEVFKIIEESSPTAIIKFGMGLLRVPDNLRCPILSYHHGDPRHFRGRPAGFYEILSGHSTLGQVVQILSNKLDAGKVVAFGETKVHSHSWRATMREAYRCSPFLLPRALENARKGAALPIEPKGQKYRLPSNWTVLRFLWRTACARARRLIYGALFEKRWKIAKAPGGADPKTVFTNFPEPSRWQIIDCPPRYRFIADPFPHPKTDAILAEGLRRLDLQGEIVSVESGRPHVMCSGPGHFSYPATICIEGGHYMIPEVSEWSAPKIFQLGPQSAEAIGRLNVESAPKLIDPTLYKAADGRIYLFANDGDAGDGVLRLWVSRSLFDQFAEHPLSPVLISPAGSRMGGAIIETNGRLYRVGQDCRNEYGDGLLLFAITDLSGESYHEELCADLRFTSKRGPHTLNLQNDQMVFDFYQDQLSPFAGVRRMRSRLIKRRVGKLAR